ncbi:MAG TPA: sulfurtransferase TusA family protein [Stenomitos sp.]
MSNLMETKTLDAQGLKCPMPIVKAKKELDALTPGDVLKVIATDKGSVLDFQGWAKTNKAAELVSQETLQGDQGQELYVHYIRRK